MARAILQNRHLRKPAFPKRPAALERQEGTGFSFQENHPFFSVFVLYKTEAKQ